jgi:hypothetical protein
MKKRSLCILLTVLSNVTLASTNSALPEDGDYTETCWSCFSVILILLLKTLFICWCKIFDNIKMHGTTVEKNVKEIYFQRYLYNSYD